MTLNIVKDNAGKVIATYEKPQGNGPSVTPELDRTHTVHEIEVAANYLHTIEAIYQQHSSK
jgi:hypothetical protein